MMNIGRRLLSSAATSGKVKVELMFDVVSPYSYFQFEQLCRNKERWKQMDLKFTPVFNFAVINDSGNQTGMISCPNKSMYTVRDSKRIAQLNNIPFGMPNNIMEQISKFRNLGALRFLTSLQSQVSPTQHESAIRTIYQSFFTEGSEIDLKDPEQLLQLALKAGIDESIAKKCIQESETDKVKDMLKANGERAVEMGAFGVPATFVYTAGEGKEPEVFWGSDRNQYIGPLVGGQ